MGGAADHALTFNPDHSMGAVHDSKKLPADFRRALFGHRSEKSAPEQYKLALEDIETAIAAIHAEDEAVDPPISLPLLRLAMPTEVPYPSICAC